MCNATCHQLSFPFPSSARSPSTANREGSSPTPSCIIRVCNILAQQTVELQTFALCALQRYRHIAGMYLYLVWTCKSAA